MNRPPETFVRVQEDRLLAFATACFERAGLEFDHAALISRLLVNSDLRGVRSHGTRALNGYCRVFEQGNLNPRPDIRTLHQTPTAVVLDGDSTLGYLPTVRAAEAAIARAREVGMGMGLVRHIGHYGAAGHYARMCLEAGCIGFSSQGSQNLGNARNAAAKPQIGYFGNPPICFALPAGDEPPVVLDAATCILADDQRGPESDALLTKIPAAFFKSIGYTAVANLLGGALAGITLPAAAETRNRWPQARRGSVVLAIHIDTVIPKDIFCAETDRMVRDVRNTYDPMPGTDRALLPGAIEEERLKEYRNQGIPYGAEEQAGARTAGKRLGIALPWD